MELTRRLLLKVGGALGATATGGFAFDAVFGPKSWLYDPSAKTEAHNLSFLSLDVADFLQQVPASYRQQVTGGGNGRGGGPTGPAPLNPEDVDRVGAVSGFSFVGDTGFPTGMGSVGISGSFQTAPYRSLLRSAPPVESAGQVGSYDVFVANTDSLTGGAPTGGTGPNGQSVSVEKTAVGLKQNGGGMVAGSTLASDDIDAPVAVEQAVKAKQGNAPLMRGANKYTEEYHRLFKDFTFYMGASWAPVLVTLLVSATSLLLENFLGPGGAAATLFEQVYEDTRAAAVGVNVGPDTTVTAIVLTYVTADAARQTGLAQLLDAGFGAVERGQGFGSGIRDVDADYSGLSVVIKVVSDTEAALSPGTGGGGGGG